MQWQQRTLMMLLLVGLPLAEAGASPASASAHLVVTTQQGETLLDMPAASGASWCIQWKHSVEHFTVLDCYRNANGVMQLERSHQPDFAAGLGHIMGRGEQVSDGKGGYWINAINEPVADNRYVLRVGAPAVNHQVVWPGGEHPAVSLSEQAAGQRVTIQLVEPSTHTISQ
ncbi:uncharacterized protein DUF1850 [Vreelandella songnenensis]|uniref:Uncharacterized protein DUF1850 n=1 Tax=Vreelandella songnenensis TaxID=1176243 RepID=A0A2T0V4L7_9GAMM|nr:DUF1850 domain-containing protein [Halomonas songnenensis]PRY65125.1 uncharacterized protein DUF1850 [Halomonas songnenensis]